MQHFSSFIFYAMGKTFLSFKKGNTTVFPTLEISCSNRILLTTIRNMLILKSTFTFKLKINRVGNTVKKERGDEPSETKVVLLVLGIFPGE